MTRSKPFIQAKPQSNIEDGSNAPTATLPEAPIATPGDTKRKKEPLPATEKPKGRPRKLLTTQELAEEETRLKSKYPHLIENSLLNATKDQPTAGLNDQEIKKFRHKRSCLIKCTCEAERRIATSDLAQVTLCPNCTTNERNRRKRERRAAAKK